MTGWEAVGHAVELRVQGVTLVAPGVAVRLDGDDQVAVVYGGHRGTVDERAVMAAARIALQDWPANITRAEIVVSEPGRVTPHDQAALAKAQAKRERRAQKAVSPRSRRPGRPTAAEVRELLEEINRS